MHASWELTYADADQLMDLRDEKLARGNDEVTGELPPDMEYEEFNEILDHIAALVDEALGVYKQQQLPLDLGAVMRDYLTRYPRARHFDGARIVFDQEVRLGGSVRFYRVSPTLADNRRLLH